LRVRNIARSAPLVNRFSKAFLSFPAKHLADASARPPQTR